jgi:hypothetical protein
VVNDAYRIWDKTGVPLTPARRISSIFTALGTPCATTDDGDPIALYDPLADRWLISQFCTIADPFNHQLIAISQTGDPTGAYFLYDFQMPNDKFNDYPKFGVWPDAYYMTDNQFNQAGTAFLGGGAFAFDRGKMLVGDPTASYIYFDLFLLDPNIGGMLPSDLDGLNAPPPGTTSSTTRPTSSGIPPTRCGSSSSTPTSRTRGCRPSPSGRRAPSWSPRSTRAIPAAGTTSSSRPPRVPQAASIRSRTG